MKRSMWIWLGIAAIVAGIYYYSKAKATNVAKGKSGPLTLADYMTAVGIYGSPST